MTKPTLTLRSIQSKDASAIAELMADPSFVTKYNDGDPAAKREMTRLNEMIVGAAA